MYSVLDDIYVDLLNLRDYVLWQSEVDLISRRPHSNPVVRQYAKFRTSAASLVHSFFVNRAYALMEYGVDELIKEYVRMVCAANLVCPAMKKRQREGLLNILKSVNDSADFDSNILNYSASISSWASMVLEAFVYEKNNYRHTTLNSIFNGIGIQDISSRVDGDNRMRAFFRKTPLGNVNSKTFLDDFVKMRNQSSHGIPRTNLLSSDQMVYYINFFSLYLEVLCDQLVEKLISIGVYDFVDVGSVYRLLPLRAASLVLFSRDYDLMKGQCLIMSDAGFTRKNTSTIVKSDVHYNDLSAVIGDRIGLGIGTEHAIGGSIGFLSLNGSVVNVSSNFLLHYDLCNK